MRGLASGSSRLAAGLTAKGKVLYFGRLVAESDRLLLVLPRDAAAAVRAHLAKYAAFQKAAVRDVSDEYVLVDVYDAAVPGPAGTGVVLPAWGELSAEILAPASGRGALEAALAAAGSTPVSDEEAEALRIEAGRPRLGADATDANLPDEVGLEEAISRTKGCYVGQEVVARRKTYGRPTRRLVGLRFEPSLLAAGTPLEDAERPGRELGRVTSAAVSPRLGPIGLGIASYDAADGTMLAAAGAPDSRAVVTPLPFA